MALNQSRPLQPHNFERSPSSLIAFFLPTGWHYRSRRGSQGYAVVSDNMSAMLDLRYRFLTSPVRKALNTTGTIAKLFFSPLTYPCGLGAHRNHS